MNEIVKQEVIELLIECFLLLTNSNAGRLVMKNEGVPLLINYILDEVAWKSLGILDGVKDKMDAVRLQIVWIYNKNFTQFQFGGWSASRTCWARRVSCCGCSSQMKPYLGSRYAYPEKDRALSSCSHSHRLWSSRLLFLWSWSVLALCLFLRIVESVGRELHRLLCRHMARRVHSLPSTKSTHQ